MTFLELIKQGLAERRMTQTQLARLLGVSQQAVSAWLRPPGVQPRWPIVRRLAETFGWDESTVRAAVFDSVRRTTPATPDEHTPVPEPRGAAPSRSSHIGPPVDGAAPETRESDREAIAALVEGQRVLITGGAGRIGREIARLITELGTDRVLIADRSDRHLADAYEDLGDKVEPKLADVALRAAIRPLIADFEPGLVVHCAGYRCEQAVEGSFFEVVRHNICAVSNVLDAAGDARVVLASTNRAARPEGILGQTRWVSEQMILAARSQQAPHVAIRFRPLTGMPDRLQERSGSPPDATRGRTGELEPTAPPTTFDTVQLALTAVAANEPFGLLGLPASVPAMEMLQRSLLALKMDPRDVMLQARSQAADGDDNPVGPAESAQPLETVPAVLAIRSPEVDRSVFVEHLVALHDVVRDAMVSEDADLRSADADLQKILRELVAPAFPSTARTQRAPKRTDTRHPRTAA